MAGGLRHFAPEGVHRLHRLRENPVFRTEKRHIPRTGRRSGWRESAAARTTGPASGSNLVGCWTGRSAGLSTLLVTTHNLKDDLRI
jgi:hypothetical protein